ncbi:metal-dependent hydrolase family protein [Phenylobacterium sp.]|uniref:Xaa-Pro dipeptidase n=1 Tax=Phenylobacterium sp. TaxID=1871053 RepID=UPI002E326BBD|nr:amidohydrolase family protein [Phenylobacterium sp.]HEX4712454.1 amidohydrolase family protein [Phenylobacterium sp.]
MRISSVAAAAMAAWAVAAGAQAATVAVSADRLLDVASGKYVEKPLLVIVDGRISAVGHQGDKVPAGAERVDLPGVTLLPGLIDMHVHLTSSPLYGGYNYLRYTDSFWPVIATRHAKDTLEAGFTTVRNVGSDNFDDVGLRQGIEEGFIEGPRIVTASYAIGSTGGHCDSTFFPPSMKQKGDAVIDTPDEGRRMVRQLHKYGAQVIKICATGGVFSHGDTPGAQQLTLEEIKAIVDEAHRTGMRVAAHAHGADGIKAAILGGVDTIEHASLVDDEGIKLAVQKGAYFGMDIYNTDYTQAEGKKNGVLEENLQKDRDIGDIQRENFRKALKAGVKMIFSTDAGVYPHGTNARQFATMVRYGATPLQAIQTATLTAAQALDQVKDVGQATPGHFGDLVGVKGDPLSDVTVLEHPVFVMKGGAVVKQTP